MNSTVALLIAALLSAFTGRRFAFWLAERHNLSGWHRSLAIGLGTLLPMQSVLVFTFTPLSWAGLRLLVLVLPLVWAISAVWIAGMAYVLERVGSLLNS